MCNALYFIPYCLIFYCTFGVGVVTSILPNGQRPSGESNKQDLSFKYSFRRNANYPNEFEKEESFELEYEEQIQITLKCFVKNKDTEDLKLKWKVDKYNLEAEQSYLGTDITILFTPDRKDNGLNVSCIATSEKSPIKNMEKYVIFRLTSRSKQSNKVSYTETPYEDGAIEKLPEHSNCKIRKNIGPNEIQFNWLKDSIVVGTEHDRTTLLCASLQAKGVKMSGIFYLETQETLILVTHKSKQEDLYYDIVGYDKHKEDTNEDHKLRTKEDQLQIVHDNNYYLYYPINTEQKSADNKNHHDPDSSFPLKEVIGGTIGLITFLIISFLVFKFIKQKGLLKLSEPIYAEPLVLYAELHINGSGPTPHREETPYAEIVGVLKPKMQRNQNQILPVLHPKIK